MLSYEEFVEKLKEIKAMGWVQTHRSGPTGIGKTLEDLLGIHENNIAGPDNEKFELKSARKNSQSMLTLFTKSPLPKRANATLLNTLGYLSAKGNGKKELHTTVSAINYNRLKGNKGFKVGIDKKASKITLINSEGKEHCYWDNHTLEKAFQKKYPALAYVKADAEGIGPKEKFHFNEAYLLSGFDFNNFMQLVQQGIIVVDIRIGQYSSGKNKGKPHDHGTGFRVKQDKLDLCFEEREKIL